MALFPEKEKTAQLSAEIYVADKARLAAEAARLGMSVRKLTAHVFRWWLEQVEEARRNKK